MELLGIDTIGPDHDQINTVAFRYSYRACQGYSIQLLYIAFQCTLFTAPCSIKIRRLREHDFIHVDDIVVLCRDLPHQILPDHELLLDPLHLSWRRDLGLLDLLDPDLLLSVDTAEDTSAHPLCPELLIESSCPFIKRISGLFPEYRG